MPSLAVYNHGSSGGIPGNNNGKGGLRGQVGGWAASSSRRNMRFLWSVGTDHLTGSGWSFTLTVRNCPATPREWAQWCATYWKRVFKHGAIRLHWVIEWQARGCPHLHGSVYFDEGITRTEVENILLAGWCYLNPFDAQPQSQRCLPIFDAVGWGQYVAKHAARGVRHYQRSPDNIPSAWKGKTGRMWGSRGLWPTSQPIRIELDGRHGDRGWFALRRLVRSYAVAQARLKGDRAAESYARTMLKAHTRHLGEVRGLSSWVPRPIIEQLVLNLVDRGFEVRSA